MDNVNIDLEKIVIDNHSKDNKYTHQEKIKYLEEAIKNGGYYDDNGIWNSIKVFDNDNHIYRLRVETLIVRGDTIFLKFYSKDSNKIYAVPGGSVCKDVPNMTQAINECREEARINIKHIQSTGITYKDLTVAPSWAISEQPVNWNGTYTEIYVADYAGEFKGYVNKLDENRFMRSGRFYDINKVYGTLRKEHRQALNLIYPNKIHDANKIKTESVLTSEERSLLRNNQFGIPSMRKFPLHDADHVMYAIKFFNTVDRIHEKELAYNLIKAMMYFNIDFSVVGERNRLKTYISQFL